jgi:hypothetical protein
MKKLTAVLVLAFGFFLADPSFTQPASSLRGRTVRQLPTCNEPKAGTTVSLSDATSQDVIGSGGGSAITVAVCDGSDWVPISTTVSSIDGNPAITLDTDDAGSDVTITPADDFLLTAGDAANLVAGGVVLIDSTAGATVTIDTDAAGSDIVATPVDDLILTIGDALTTTTGGAASIVTTAGAVTITAGGTTQDVGINSVDDIVLTPTDALTATVGGAATVTTTAGVITLTVGGTTEDMSLISADQVIVDGAGGADELVIDDDEVLVGAAAAFRLAIAAAPPVACASGTKASMYYDSDINKVCICNGTNYVLANDDSTTTGCS